MKSPAFTPSVRAGTRSNAFLSSRRRESSSWFARVQSRWNTTNDKTRRMGSSQDFPDNIQHSRQKRHMHIKFQLAWEDDSEALRKSKNVQKYVRIQENIHD